MTANKVKLNGEKTEALYVASSNGTKYSVEINIDGNVIPLEIRVKISE